MAIFTSYTTHRVFCLIRSPLSSCPQHKETTSAITFLLHALSPRLSPSHVRQHSAPTRGDNLGNGGRAGYSPPSVRYAPLFTKFHPSPLSCAHLVPVGSPGYPFSPRLSDLTPPLHICSRSLSYRALYLIWRISFSLWRRHLLSQSVCSLIACCPPPVHSCLCFLHSLWLCFFSFLFFLTFFSFFLSLSFFFLYNI